MNVQTLHADTNTATTTATTTANHSLTTIHTHPSIQTVFGFVWVQEAFFTIHRRCTRRARTTTVGVFFVSVVVVVVDCPWPKYYMSVAVSTQDC